MKTLKYILVCSVLLFGLGTATAQCDSTATIASNYLGEEFVSDGQVYRALLYGDQVAEFKTTFYGGAKYRIISYAGFDQEQLVFSLVDEDKNVLFTNADHTNSPYWDFEFDATIEGKLEAKLDLTKQNSGCAVILIGFER